MADIFISYKKEDRPLTEDVIQRLEEEGFSVWYDERLTPSESWDALIEQEISAAKAVLVLWTKRAVESEWVRTEADYAKEHQKYVPVMLERCALPLAFRRIQTADLSHWDGNPNDRNWRKVIGWLESLILSKAEQKERNKARAKPPARAPGPAATSYEQPRTGLPYGWIFGVVMLAVIAAAGYWNWPVIQPLIFNEPAFPHKVDEELNQVMYVSSYSEIAVYARPTIDSDSIGTLQPDEAVNVTGKVASGNANDREWYQIVGPDGKIGYVLASLLTDEPPEARRDQEAWDLAQAQDTIAAYETYLEQFPNGTSAELARNLRDELKEREAWATAQARNSVTGYREYLDAYASGSNAETARNRIAELQKPKTPANADARSTPSSTRAPIISSDPSALPDFALFRECAKCPDMVVIPAGSFTMGSPSTEPKRDTDEGPQTRVSIRRFAIARFETTWDEWDACVSAGYCNQGPVSEAGGDNSYGKGQRPVIEVDWSDAGVYASYVNTVSRGGYRRPTEAEWEYAARGGTTSAYPWGSSASHQFANYGKDDCCGGLASGRDQWVNTAPVGQFPDNPFGLYDMLGNVWEWVEDCYRNSLSGQNSNGAAYLGGACTYRVFRGGSSGNTPEFLRSARRFRNPPTYRGNTLGFRLARTL